MPKQNTTRSLTILFALFVGVLFSGCTSSGSNGLGQEKSTTPSEENVVEVIVRGQPVPEDFTKTLQGLDIGGVLLITKSGQIQAITPAGASVDLCQSGTETCKLGITTSELVSELSGGVANLIRECGRCEAGGNLWRCKISSSRYSCRSGNNSCSTVCE